MSANAGVMSNLQTALTDFLGGGISVQGPTGGFSTTLDPATGTYKTVIKAGNTTVSTAGVGQAPGGLWNQLTGTTSGQLLLGAGIIIAAIIAFATFGKRG